MQTALYREPGMNMKDKPKGQIAAFLQSKTSRHLALAGMTMTISGLLFLAFVWQLRFIAGALCGVGLLLFFCSWIREKNSHCQRVAKLFGMIFLSSFLIIEFLVFRGMTETPEGPADTLIILGAKVNGSHLSITLQDRLAAARNYLEENPHAIAVVSGGQGKGEDISEAAAMRAALLAQGISAERILTEAQSTTTQENLLYSQRILEEAGHPVQRVLIVTSDYHVFRACQMAKKYFPSVEGLPGKSDTALRMNYAIREYFAVVKMLLLMP